MWRVYSRPGNTLHINTSVEIESVTPVLQGLNCTNSLTQKRKSIDSVLRNPASCSIGTYTKPTTLYYILPSATLSCARVEASIESFGVRTATQRYKRSGATCSARRSISGGYCKSRTFHNTSNAAHPPHHHKGWTRSATLYDIRYTHTHTKLSWKYHSSSQWARLLASNVIACGGRVAPLRNTWANKCGFRI